MVDPVGVAVVVAVGVGVVVAVAVGVAVVVGAVVAVGVAVVVAVGVGVVVAVGVAVGVAVAVAVGVVVAVVSSHLEKTHAKLKDMGYQYAKVEYFNPWSRTTLDLFGLHDTVAIRGDKPGVWGINSCGEDISTHIDKYLHGYKRAATENRPEKVFGPNECLLPWLQAGNRFEIWGWRKRGGRDKRKLWTLRRIEFLLTSFEFRVEGMTPIVLREVTEETEVEDAREGAD